MTPLPLVYGLPTRQYQWQRNHKGYTALMRSSLRMSPLAPKEDCLIIEARETAVTMRLDMCTIQATVINAFRELISVNFSTGVFILR